MIKVAAGAFISLNNISIIGLIIGLFAHYTVGGINDEASNLMLLIDNIIFGLSLGILTKIFVLKERSY